MGWLTSNTSTLSSTSLAYYWAILHDHCTFITFMASSTCVKHAVAWLEKISLLSSRMRRITSRASTWWGLNRWPIPATTSWFWSKRKLWSCTYRLALNICLHILSHWNLFIVLVLVYNFTFELCWLHKLTDLECFLCASTILISFLD